MKKLLFLFAITLIAFTCFSQTPGIRWQRTLGGPSPDFYFFTLKSIDNGIISIENRDDGSQGLCIEKFTADGICQWQKLLNANLDFIDRAVSYQYNTDGSLVVLCHGIIGFSGSGIYIVKIDKDGNVLWEKRFSGDKENRPSYIIKSINGGYLVTGNTNSSTFLGMANHGSNAGSVDSWVIKLSEDGEIIWQKILGGVSTEGNNRNTYVGKLMETSDGSVYLYTETYSNDGDVSGNHGGQDLWLVKLTSNGSIEWTKTLGGTYDEFSSDLKLLPSGDILVLGTSWSPELTVNGLGQPDLYVARVTPTGDLLSQRCYGTTGEDQGVQIASVDADGSCVLLGQVSKDDGNVQNFHGPVTGKMDIWVCKIDQAGNIVWQNCIGGSGDDRVIEDVANYDNFSTGGIIQTSEGGYVISGVTRSNDGDINGFHTVQDLFVVKLSALGITEWTRCLGGNRVEFARGLPVELRPNEYVTGAYTLSSDGDIQRYYGSGDGWLVKLSSINTIKGAVFIDQNSNGTKDGDEPFFSDVHINISKGQDSRTVVPDNGRFSVTTDTGTFSTRITPDHPYYTISSPQFTSNFSTYFNTDSFSIGLQPIAGIRDLSINVSPLTVARPGFDVKYTINYKNASGTAIPSGEILFKKDSRLTLLSSVPVISSSVGDTLKWNYTDLDPGESGVISINMRLSPPPAVNINDTLSSAAIITPVADDIASSDNTAIIRQLVQGSYDPNDKIENLGGKITQTQISSGEYINYLIRFQNTGTDTAFNVIVRDTLDANLDWSSLEMVAASHPYQLLVNSSNQLEWNFNNIDLPDSNKNEPASHGFIAYRIKPKASLGTGATIINSASIYFDFNLPVLTNQAFTIVQTINVALPLRLLEFNAVYQKPDAVLEWSTSEEVNVDRFEIERGTDPLHFTSIGRVAAHGNDAGSSTYRFSDDLGSINGDVFFYRLKMIDIDGKFKYSDTRLLKREGGLVNDLIITPNPVNTGKGFAFINFGNNANAEFSVVDIQGRVTIISHQKINKGYNVVPLDLSSFRNGNYMLVVKTAHQQLVSKFVLNR